MWIIFLLLLTGIAQADVYVITDSNGSVYDISNQPDAVVPKGYTLTVMKGQNIQNLPITNSPQLYNFSNGSFTLNKSKVQAQQAIQAESIAQDTAREQAKASALAKLADAIGKVATQDLLTDQEINAVLNQ